MKAALYARVSKEEQNEELQLRDMREFCTRHGWEITDEYIDHGISGKKPKRPAFDRLTADARRRAFDVVLVWKLDRVMRSVQFFSNWLAQMKAWKVDFVCSTQPIDTSDPLTGDLIRNILAAVAEWEGGMISARVRAGLATARARGKRLGRPPAVVDRDKLASLYATLGSAAAVAREMGVSERTIKRALLRGGKNLSSEDAVNY